MKKIIYRFVIIVLGMIVGRLIYDVIFHQEKFEDLTAYIIDFHFIMMCLIGGISITGLLLLSEHFSGKK